MTYQLPNLPYSYDALEPHFDEQTMTIHHTKHHQGYTDKLNAAVARADKAGYTLHGKALSEHSAESLLMHINLIPDVLVEAIANNGGGFVNHNLFWSVLSPEADANPSGELLLAIKESFGSFEAFQEEFSEMAKTHFGSGWAWLVVNHDKELEVVSTPNQDSPLMSGLVPILALDCWEHSYYLSFQNKRPDYVAAFWNVVNWKEVARRYSQTQ
ncbi:MAG: superoxide dismutase [Candidatus Woesearchaeota archaeon]